MAHTSGGNIQLRQIKTSDLSGGLNADQFVTATGALTAARPLLYDANGNAVVSTVQGNTTQVQMASGSPTTGYALIYDADGNAVPASGPPLITASQPVNAQTGTTYTIVSGDNSKLVTFSNASAVAVTLPQATGSFAAGWFADVRNKGAGTVTITPTTSTINGASTLVLLQDQGARIVSDGTNYQITAFSVANLAGSGAGGVTGILPVANGGSGTSTPSLVAGTNVTLSGSWPNQTVNASGGGGGGTAWPYPTTPTTGAPPSAGWTWDNQGTSTIDQSNGYEFATFASGTGSDILRLRYRTAPATPYTLSVAYSAEMGDWANNGGNGTQVGTFVCFRDSTGKVLIFQWDTNGAQRLVTQDWPNGANNVTGVANHKLSSSSGAQGALTFYAPVKWVRIEDNGTNLIFYYSIDYGNTWLQFDSVSRTTYFASGPTQIGYGAYVNGGKVRMAIASWV